MGLIKRWLLRRALKKPLTKSDMENVADEMLKEAMKEMQKTRSTANTILKAKMIRQESRKTLEDIHELNEDEDEDEEEFEEPMTMEDQITQILISKFLGVPGAAVPNPQQVAESPALQETLGSLTPDQIEKLKAKFLG